MQNNIPDRARDPLFVPELSVWYKTFRENWHPSIVFRTFELKTSTTKVQDARHQIQS
jgi:hypothetical protein